MQHLELNIKGSWPDYSGREISKPHGKWNPELASETEADFEKTYSSEQIQHSRKLKGLFTVAFKTLYNWLYADLLSRGKSKACVATVATFMKQKTRCCQAIKMPNRTALSIEIVFGVLAAQYPKSAI